jgi:DedD protein
MANQKASDPEKRKKVVPPGVIRRNLFRAALYFLAGTWLFVLGVLVGRGTAPVNFDIGKLQRQLAELKQKAVAEAEKRYKIDLKSLGDKSDLDFYEALKGAGGKDDVKRDLDRIKPLPPAEPLPIRQEAAKAKPPETETGKTAQQPGPATLTEKKPEPVAVKKADARPPPKPEAKTVSHPEVVQKDPARTMVIQVAAMKDPKEADGLVARLKNRGYSAFRTAAEVPGRGTWYRVRIGYFRDAADAAETLGKLQRDKLKAFLVRP